jgi:hypothetical protein
MNKVLLIALVLAGSCKKESPKGDLPPATDWQAGSQAAGAKPPPAAAPNPHADLGSGAPHGTMPAQGTPRTLEKLPDGRLAMGPFTMAVPADWTAKPITSSMRAADFVLPGKPGEDAELIVYYFSAGGAGSIEDNVNRWLDQFEQPSGKPSREVAKIEKTKFAGQDATFVSLTGRYHAAAMPGATEMVDKADQALLAAIVGSPQGPYYFKLVGARTTVEASAKAFRTLLDSLKLR